MVEDEAEGSTPTPANNSDEDDDAGGEEQAEVLPEEHSNHQVLTRVEEQETIQVEDNNLEREHREEATSIMEVEDGVRIIIPPIQVHSPMLRVTYHTPPSVTRMSLDQLRLVYCDTLKKNIIETLTKGSSELY